LLAASGDAYSAATLRYLAATRRTVDPVCMFHGLRHVIVELQSREHFR
jgi:hypothetical protein